MAASNHPEISATELELKRRGRRRLIGAITIGLLAIVFLPMIFDREPKRSGQTIKTQDISVQVPSKEGQPALPAPAVSPIVVPAPVTIDVPKVAAVPEADKPATVAAPPPAKETVKVAPKPVVKTEKPAKAEAKPMAGNTGFVVQLGVFSDADNAKQVIAKMKEAKLTVHTENIPIKSGNATRVRVGPYATRDKAEAALAQVKLAGADGKIVSLN
jgi:DedD protein